MSAGVLPRADVHVNNGRIEAVGPDLTAAGAEVIDAADMIVMPGFIDTHYHMWSALGRNFVGDGFGYFPAKNATSTHYQPVDFYNSVLLGLVELANAGVTLNTAYLRPRSRGTVRLAGRDPNAAPLIDPNYWEDSYDRQMSIAGVNLAREIMRQNALKPFVLAERVPGPACKSDEDIAEYAFRSAKTDHHPAGTCAMGTGKLSVVSPELKLHGIDGLRVCDASVMP